MFRFTIRDVLWLTVVVGMGLVWWLDHRYIATEKQRIRAEWDTATAKKKEALAMNRTASEMLAKLRRATNAKQAMEALPRPVPKPLTESELERIKQESAKLGAPQPQPLPPGYGENPHAAASSLPASQ